MMDAVEIANFLAAELFMNQVSKYLNPPATMMT
jgi:hypothetical protein